MPSLNGQISFDVLFDLTGNPTLKLTASTTIPLLDRPNLTGYFKITQPDEISTEGNYTTPDIIWNGSGYDVFEKLLRLASDQTYQRGDYIITFFADCDGYTPGEFTRTFNINYQPVTQSLRKSFDCFTPKLEIEDITNYSVSNFSIASATIAWAATSPAGNPTSTVSLFDLAISSSYYDSSYAVTLTKNLTYQHTSFAWLSVTERFVQSFTEKAYIPGSMATQLNYLDALKGQRDASANCQGDYEYYDKQFQLATTLFALMRTKVCAQDTDGLKEIFSEFYQITHNGQLNSYTNTNSIIPAYDFTTGCGGSGGVAGTTVVIQCAIGSAYNISGSTDTVTGLSDGDTVVTCNAFANKRLRVIRGSVPIPSINPGDGSNYFTKTLAATSFTLSSPLATGELIIIETIPN